VGYINNGAETLKPHATSELKTAEKKKKDEAVAASLSSEELNVPVILSLFSVNSLTASFAFFYYKQSKQMKTYSAGLLEEF